MEKLMTKQELAEFLKLSPYTVEYLRKKKGMPYLKLGKKTVRYRIEDVVEWLKQKTEKKCL